MNLSVTFSAVETSTIAPMLGLDGAELKSFLSNAKELVETVTDAIVRLKPNDENQSGGGVAGQVVTSAVDVMRKKLEASAGI